MGGLGPGRFEHILSNLRTAVGRETTGSPWAHGPTGPKALSLCFRSGTAVGTRPGADPGPPWADSMEDRGGKPPPPVRFGRCLFLGVGCRRPRRGQGEVGTRLSDRLEGAVTHPVPLPLRYPSLFQELFLNEETGVLSWKVFCPRPQGFQQACQAGQAWRFNCPRHGVCPSFPDPLLFSLQGP